MHLRLRNNQAERLVARRVDKRTRMVVIASGVSDESMKVDIVGEAQRGGESDKSFPLGPMPQQVEIKIERIFSTLSQNAQSTDSNICTLSLVQPAHEQQVRIPPRL